MKKLLFILFVLCPFFTFAQARTPLPHGTTFGVKPSVTGMMEASKIEAYMGKMTRISTTLRGKVIKVTRPIGGWFELDAGNGKVIAAHFVKSGINIPADLAGKIVIAEGVAQKQFIANDGQHLAGDTVTGKKQHTVNADPKKRLTFEVKGLMVDE